MTTARGQQVNPTNRIFLQNFGFWRGLLPRDVAEVMAARSAREGVLNDTDAASQKLRASLLRSANALARSRGLRRDPPSERLKELIAENMNKRFIRKVRRIEGGKTDDPLEQEVLRLMNPES